MPQRPRAHQLEAASNVGFQSALPASWVCRPKSSDYGIDFEVEIFDENGFATGLLFYVQIKATDNIKNEKTLLIDRDRLEYLLTFDAPAITLRFCATSCTIHWAWAFNLKHLLQNKSKKLLVRFANTDKWNQDTPAQIYDTLKAIRKIRGLQATTLIALRRSYADEVAYSLEAEECISQITRAVPHFIDARDNATKLEIHIHFRIGEVYLAIADLASVRVELRNGGRYEILCALAYALTLLMRRSATDAHAARMANFCLDNSLTAPSDDLAIEAVYAFSNDPQRAADTAILNKLHCQTNPMYPFVVRHIHNCKSNKLEVFEGLIHFFKAVRTDSQSPGVKATAAYSIANTYNSFGFHRQAIHYFNEARKADPEYNTRAYFCEEIAGALFLSKRYRFARQIYESRFTDSDDANQKIRLGDAQMFSGVFDEAQKLFACICEKEDRHIAAEARLKLRICRYLQEEKVHRIGYKSWLLQNLDEAARVSDWPRVSMNAIACAFMDEGAPETWARAILASVHDAEVFFDVFYVATFRTKADAFREVEKIIEPHLEGGAEVKMWLRELQMQAMKEALPKERVDSIRCRFVGGPYFDFSLDV